MVVIRYDAKLIRLNGEMINSLFHVERHNDIRKNAELPLEARLQIEFKESVGDQPDGVLVGTLFVQSDTDVEERILINAVVEVLSDALRKNLSSSVNELSLQRDVIKMNIDDIETELKALYEEAKQFEQAKQMSMQMEALQRLEARRLDKEIETRVSDQRRDLLGRRLDEMNHGPGILRSAFRCDVPVFIPAMTPYEWWNQDDEPAETTLCCSAKAPERTTQPSARNNSSSSRMRRSPRLPLVNTA